MLKTKTELIFSTRDVNGKYLIEFDNQGINTCLVDKKTYNKLCVYMDLLDAACEVVNSEKDNRHNLSHWVWELEQALLKAGCVDE